MMKQPVHGGRHSAPTLTMHDLLRAPGGAYSVLQTLRAIVRTQFRLRRSHQRHTLSSSPLIMALAAQPTEYPVITTCRAHGLIRCMCSTPTPISASTFSNELCDV